MGPRRLRVPTLKLPTFMGSFTHRSSQPSQRNPAETSREEVAAINQLIRMASSRGSQGHAEVLRERRKTLELEEGPRSHKAAFFSEGELQDRYAKTQETHRINELIHLKNVERERLKRFDLNSSPGSLKATLSQPSFAAKMDSISPRVPERRSSRRAAGPLASPLSEGDGTSEGGDSGSSPHSSDRSGGAFGSFPRSEGGRDGGAVHSTPGSYTAQVIAAAKAFRKGRRGVEFVDRKGVEFVDDMHAPKADHVKDRPMRTSSNARLSHRSHEPDMSPRLQPDVSATHRNRSTSRAARRLQLLVSMRKMQERYEPDQRRGMSVKV